MSEKSCMIISADAKMKKVLEIADNVATSRASVLLMGESGTGKELVARFIHSKSLRQNAPFIAINCAAVPEGLLESELFGHERGSFTGAIQTKLGKFEIAQGGTLLLDEMGELPLHLQSKLLRALQEGEIERVGGVKPIKVNVRVIATTNRNLEEMVLKGLFREDLYYRLNVIPIVIPPLRLRHKDLEMLAQHFLEISCMSNTKPLKVLSPEAKEKILKYDWPGNVRELENVIERAVLLSQSEVISADELSIKVTESTNVRTLGPGMTVFEAEKLLILNTLEYTSNNKTHAAKLLGISVRTLRNKLHEYKGGVYEQDL